MSKHRNASDGILITIIIIVAPIVMFYQWVGPILFWGIIIGVPTFWLAYKVYSHQKPSAVRHPPSTKVITKEHTPRSTPIASPDNADAVLGEIRKRIHLGDWDTARRMLRSIAWETHRHSSQEFKSAFKDAMCGFAMQDPLFNLVLPSIKQHIMGHTGCMQSGIYRHFTRFDVEDLRYVLYYGEALGHIVRVKKGNSYALYLPEQPAMPSQVVDDRLTDDEQAFLQEMKAKPSIRLPCSDYWQRRLGNPDQLLKQLRTQGHFRGATLPELLQQLTKPELAAALKQQGLPVSGSKAELIKRLCDHAPDSAEALVSDLHVYIPT